MNNNKRLDPVGTRRRWLAAAVGWPGLACVGATLAQANEPVVIGWLNLNSNPRDGDRALDAFNEGMAALGWKLGTHYVLEERHSEGRLDRLAALAREIAAKRPAIIVATPSSSVRAAAAAAPTTPIVVSNGDPLTFGLVNNLARPGGLITGVSNVSNEAGLKVVEFLAASMPRLQRVGFLVDSSGPSRGAASIERARRAAAHSRVAAVIADMAKPEDIDAAMARLAKDKAQALVLMPSQWFFSYFPKIIPLALAQRWPVAGNLHAIPEQGGLLSFGADTLALARRSAYYVDRILKGTKPGELPIEQPTSFRLVINMKTARALGLIIPPSVLIRATEVIERSGTAADVRRWLTHNQSGI